MKLSIAARTARMRTRLNLELNPEFHGVLRELLWRRSSRGCWVAQAHMQVKWPQRQQSRDVFRKFEKHGAPLLNQEIGLREI